jgi:hypothetical protein
LDSIANCEGERFGRIGRECEPNRVVASLRIGLNANGVRVGFDEGMKLPFEIIDVLIGPFDL